MIILDLIVRSLQANGGISVYFDSIYKRLASGTFSFDVVGDGGPTGVTRFDSCLFIERYRDVKLKCYRNGVFHSSYYRLPFRRTSSLKVVTTVHDFTYEKFVKGPAQWVHSWQKNRAIRHSDIVICVSQNTAKDLMHYCPIDPARIRVIYNGVSDNYYPLTDHPSVSNHVLFVGARGGYKNFNLAVEAVAAIPELELHIVGGGPLTKSECKQLDVLLQGRYRWLGRLSDEGLNIAYNSAYALLYPSSYEGFGIPILEAMRAGCPVIAVNVSSIPEVAGEAALLVERASAELFGAALQQIPERCNELRQAGFQQAAKFSWDRCFDETLIVYKELL